MNESNQIEINLIEIFPCQNLELPTTQATILPPNILIVSELILLYLIQCYQLLLGHNNYNNIEIQIDLPYT